MQNELIFCLFLTLLPSSQHDLNSRLLVNLQDCLYKVYLSKISIRPALEKQTQVERLKALASFEIQVKKTRSVQDNMKNIYRKQLK